jgi:hypothetical protein
MTEAQWRRCASTEALLNHLTDRASPRKLRLYAIGCWQGGTGENTTPPRGTLLTANGAALCDTLQS